MHVTLTTRPWGVHMVTKLGNAWSRPCCGMGQHWQSTDEVPGETKTFKQAVHTQVETKKSMHKEPLLT